MSKNTLIEFDPVTPGFDLNRRGSSVSGTLQRGLAVMDILLRSGQPLSLAEIAAKVELDLSTTLRLLRTLEEARQVIRITDGKRYLASPKALRPLPLLHPLEQLRRETAPILRELASKVSKTVVLVAYLGMERLVVEVMQSPGSLSPYYQTWLAGPLHASGPGKALLLTMDKKSRQAVLGAEPYASFTEKTLTTWEELDHNLQRASQSGVVIVRDEFYDGLTAVAANFSGWDGCAIGCIAITGHSSDFDTKALEAVSNELLNCTKLMPFQTASLKLIEQLVGR